MIFFTCLLGKLWEGGLKSISFVDANGSSLEWRMDTWIHTLSESKCVSQDGKECRFPFPFNSRNYTWCTQADHSESWCVLGSGSWIPCPKQCLGYEETVPTCLTQKRKVSWTEKAIQVSILIWWLYLGVSVPLCLARSLIRLVYEGRPRGTLVCHFPRFKRRHRKLGCLHQFMPRYILLWERQGQRANFNH